MTGVEGSGGGLF